MQRPAKIYLFVEYTRHGVRQRWSLRDAHNPDAVRVDLRNAGAENVVLVEAAENLPEGPL